VAFLKFLEKDKEKEMTGKRPSLPPLPKLEPIKETSMFAKKIPPPSKEMPLFPELPEGVPPPPPPVPRELPSPFVEEIRSVGREAPRPMVRPVLRARPAPPPLPPFPQPRRISPAEIATVERMEEREVGKERKELEELKKRAPKKTIFVEINDFKELLEGIGDIREHLGEHEAILDKLVAIKNEEDRHFDKWQAQLTDLQRKLLFVDKTLFETKYV
jgi:hypothetical protein